MSAAGSMRTRVLVWLAVTAGLLVVIAANAHLVIVANDSQPECVSHERDGSGAAARSACRPEPGTP